MTGLWSRRYLVLRRVTQLGILLVFFGSLHWGWKVAGSPVLRGDLSASTLVGLVPLADPLAALQILATRHVPDSSVLLGALVVVLFYGVVGGRVFCSWVCPINPVADLAAWMRRKLGWKGTLRLDRRVRDWVLGLTLVLSAWTGLAAFEWISPIGMVHRSVIFGMGVGWIGAAAIFLFDLLVDRQGWCGHLCPLGAFYGLLGRAAQIRVAFDATTCTRCGDCLAVCPEPHVLNFEHAGAAGLVVSGDCTNCGRCTPICPEGSLGFAWRARVRRPPTDLQIPRARRAS